MHVMHVRHSLYNEKRTWFKSVESTPLTEMKDDDIFLTQSVYPQPSTSPEHDNSTEDFIFRFGEPLTEKDIAKKIETCVPRTTRYKNDWAFSTFKRWQEERKARSICENLDIAQTCLTEELVDMSPSTINMALKYFVFEARKLNGSRYTSDTIQGLFTALQNGLRLKGKDINLFDDEDFKESRKCLDAAMKELSRQGLGSSARKKTETISVEDEERLWTSGSLAEDNPQQLLDTVLYLTGLHFALLGGREHRALRLFSNPQITGPHTDHNGRKYLLYTEDASKTNPGGLKHRKLIPKQVRACESKENPKRCFVRLFEKYRSLCKAGQSTQHFYFSPSRTRSSDGWYSTNAVGHNTLQATVKRLCKTSGVEGTKSNHSLRATAATRLYQAEVDEQMICEITGHRSEAVRNYKRTSDVQMANVSDILGMSKEKKPTPSTSKEADLKDVADSTPEKTEKSIPRVTLNFTFN